MLEILTILFIFQIAIAWIYALRSRHKNSDGVHKTISVKVRNAYDKQSDNRVAYAYKELGTNKYYARVWVSDIENGIMVSADTKENLETEIEKMYKELTQF